MEVNWISYRPANVGIRTVDIVETFTPLPVLTSFESVFPCAFNPDVQVGNRIIKAKQQENCKGSLGSCVNCPDMAGENK